MCWLPPSLRGRFTGLLRLEWAGQVFCHGSSTFDVPHANLDAYCIATCMTLLQLFPGRVASKVMVGFLIGGFFCNVPG